MADAYRALADTLQQAQQGAYDRNPWLASGRVLNPANATTPYGAAATSVIQGLLAGYGMKSAGDEVAGMNQQVAEAQRTGNFNGLMQDPNLSQVGLQMALGQQQQIMDMNEFVAKARITGIANESAKQMFDPRAMYMAQAQGQTPILGGDNPAGIPGSAPAAPAQNPIMPVSAGMPAPIAAANPVDGSGDLLTRQRQLVIQGGLDPNQAMQVAQGQIDNERKVQVDRQVKEQAMRDEYLKNLDETAKAADTLITMGQKVTSAAPYAITGPGGGIRRGLNEAVAGLTPDFLGGAPEATKAFNANSEILSVAPDVLGQARAKIGPGSGTMTEGDRPIYMGGGANLNQTPEMLMQYGNQYLLDGTLAKQSVDFKRMFITNGGNPAQAETIWTKYVDNLKAQPGLTAQQVPDWKQALLPMLQGQAPQQQQEIQSPLPMGGAGPGNPSTPPQGGSQGLTPSSPGDALLSAIKSVESNPRNPNAVSSKGAQGAFQIMPETAAALAARLGITNYDPADPEQQKQIAAEHIADSFERWGSLPLAIAAYNYGDTKLAAAVQRAGSKEWADVSKFVPAETRNYVPKVLTNLKAIQEQGAPAAAPAEIPQAAQAATEQPTDLLGPGTNAQRFARQLAGGLSANIIPFNIGDEVVGGGAAAIDALRNISKGERPGLSEAYDRRLQEIQDYQKNYNQSSPTGGIAESIAGQAMMPVGKLFQGAKTAAGSIARIAGASGLLGALYGAGAGGQGSDKGRGESAVETGLTSAAMGPALALGVKGATKLTSAAAEKIATSEVAQNVINALRNIGAETGGKSFSSAMRAAPEAGAIKLNKATLPAVATADDVAVLKLAQNPKVEQLQEALATLEKGGLQTLPEATKNPALALQLKELANNPETMNDIRAVIGQRQVDAPSRVAEAFSSLSKTDDALSGNSELLSGAKTVLQQAKQEIRKIAAPAYEAMAKEVPVLDSKKMAALVKSPTIKTYIRGAKAEFATEKLSSTSSQVVKQALSDMGADLRKMKTSVSATPSEIRRFTLDYNALKNEAYRLNPAMKAADEAYAKALSGSPLKEKGLQALGLIEDGDATNAVKVIFGSGSDALTHPQIGAIRERFAQAGQTQKWNDFVKSYIVKTIEEAPNVTENSFAGISKSLNKLIGSTAQERKLEAAVGPKLFPDIKALLTNEQTYLEGSRMLGGSQTQPLQAAAANRRGIMSAIGNWKDFAIEGIGKLLTPGKDVEQYRRIAETLVNPQQSKAFLQRIIPLQKTLEGIQKSSAAIQKGGVTAGVQSTGIASGKKKK
jgi:hypothetical protein